MSAALAELAEVVRRESGIRLRDSQYQSLAAAARRAAPELDPAGMLQALAVVRSGAPLLRRLIDEVTVNETFFFRQSEELEALDWAGMLAVAHAAGSDTVRIWVAGCSTGEEAYTLALLASEAFAPAPAPISILATDICTDALALAETGHYRARSVRGVSSRRQALHFEPHPGGTAVGDRLRGLVRFGRHNLARDPMPPAGQAPFDLITCRNVLIYFDRPTVERVATALAGAVRPGGRLLLGAADRISGRTGSAIPDRDAAPRPVRRRQPPLPAPPRRPRAAVAVAAGDEFAAALAAADAGRLDTAIELIGHVLAADPLNADAHFVRGLAELGAGDANACVKSLRRALYVDPGFALAAFKLGRAQEACGDSAAAAQAYEQALRTLDGPENQRPQILGDVDMGDIAAACRLRLRALTRTAS
jgi:chemotaxis protein methyltransferase CheR